LIDVEVMIVRRVYRLTGLAAVLVMFAGVGRAEAQRSAMPLAAVEFTAGYAAFVDDGAIDHGVLGAALRVPLTPRLSIGPEFVYMRGPGEDRDLFLTGNLTFDLLGPRSGQSRRVTPFLVVGGGFSQFSNGFNGSTYSSYEGAVTGGGGVRVWVTPRVYVASELRIGWEPHMRITGTVGIALPSDKR
jgi:hypothetical protein